VSDVKVRVWMGDECLGELKAPEEEERMTQRQEEELALIMKTIRYHLKLDGHEVTEAEARNVAAHLMLVVPAWREQRGPTV